PRLIRSVNKDLLRFSPFVGGPNQVHRSWPRTASIEMHGCELGGRAERQRIITPQDPEVSGRAPTSALESGHQSASDDLLEPDEEFVGGAVDALPQSPGLAVGGLGQSEVAIAHLVPLGLRSRCYLALRVRPPLFLATDIGHLLDTLLRSGL